jgi:type IV pilus assembly protein PilV
MNISRLKSQGRERGMTMIEVLVSIAVFAFGMLGVAGLMVLGIKSSYSSQQRSFATQLAYDIMDRTRANNVGANAGNYNQAASSSSAAAYTTQKTACVGATASATGCIAADMAQNDLYEWEANVKKVLGNSAAGIICLDSSGQPGSYNGTTITPQCDGLGATYSVKIYWLDERGQSQTATPTYQAFVTRFLP